MTKKQFVCEKEMVKDDADLYCKLTIFEKTNDNGLEVLDITHHDTEMEANDWLKKQWEIEPPPKIGERYHFEHDSPSD